MTRRRFIPTAVLLSLALAGEVVSAEAPVAVSPGHASKLALVEARCPTFSWGEVEGAKSYELVVYRVGERGEQAKPELRQGFAGSVDSWTPSLDRCLERGGQYAWSVRAMGGSDAPEWSSPSLFEVAAGPSEAEFEEAVEVVRQYLEHEDTRRPVSGPSSASGPVTAVPPTEGIVGPTPLSLVGAGDADLQVNGSPVLTEATLGASCLGRRWLDQGDGTVLDCNTRLTWLKDASCLGTGTWGDVSVAGTVQDLVGFLNTPFYVFFGCTDYNGTYTDWRVPAAAEFCSAFGTSTPDRECPVANYATSLVDTRFSGTPTVSNAGGDGIWVASDPFVGVLALNYWMADIGAAPDGAAIQFSLLSGLWDTSLASGTRYVWPVRGGQ